MCYIFYCNTYPLLACDILKFNMFDMLAAASAMAGVVYVTTEHNRLYTCNLTTPSALNVFFFFSNAQMVSHHFSEMPPVECNEAVNMN